ncbi:hypothetical protein EV182_001078 [Spiromyces aspiralis]|uniref:Uncharacterized protein n=1 Tax=Spiromyces aspiralis TaxID=68401 RepID=A0ACC1HK68_9FUNG|nr:hypothetical protein EV182_001078 [Spiromyces aspiralis]
MSKYFVKLPERVSFWDPALSYTRKRALKYIGRQLLILTVTIWTVLSLFLGANYNTPKYLPNLRVGIYDFDQTELGSLITNTIISTINSPTQITFERVPTSGYRSVEDVIEVIRHDKWGGVVIGANLTESVLLAVATDERFSVDDKVYALYSEGRQVVTADKYVQTPVREAAGIASYVVANYALSAIKARLDSGQDAYTESALTPIEPQIINVAPLSFPLGAIYPILGFILSYLFIMIPSIIIRSLIYPISNKISFHSLLVWKFAFLMVWNLVMAVFSTLALLAFKGPNYSKLSYGLPFTAGRWFSIMGIMLAYLTNACFFFNAGMMLLPVDMIAVVSLFFVLPNVASLVIDPTITSRFFRWFYILPFHTAGGLYQYVLSGAYPRLGRDISLLVGEIAGTMALWVLFEYIRYVWINNGKCDASGWHAGYFIYLGPGYPKPSADTGTGPAPVATAIPLRPDASGRTIINEDEKDDK